MNGLSVRRRSKFENESHRGQVSGKRRVYLCQNHKTDQAVTLKEECNSHWNLGWILPRARQLDLSAENAWGVDSVTLSVNSRRRW